MMLREEIARDVMRTSYGVLGQAIYGRFYNLAVLRAWFWSACRALAVYDGYEVTLLRCNGSCAPGAECPHCRGRGQIEYFVPTLEWEPPSMEAIPRAVELRSCRACGGKGYYESST